MYQMIGAHSHTFFKSESHLLPMLGISFRDKTYGTYVAERNWSLARQEWFTAEKEYENGL